MKNLHQRPLLILALCVALSLSSVGLPVMIVVCRMGSEIVTKSCVRACHDAGTSTQRITRPPCRAQVLFIERNATAYLPAKPDTDFSGLRILFMLPVRPLPTGMISSNFAEPETSPPFTRDNIPILFSSLLI